MSPIAQVRSPADAGLDRLHVALILALWVLTHPWAGLTHDALIYAAQARLHTHPEVFAADPFFAHGSQDRFSLFGRLYAWLVEAIGLADAARLLWALAQGLWVVFATAWIRALVPPERRILAAAMVFGISAAYGSHLALRVAEPFLTARALAEPIAALAILLVASGRRAPAAVSLAAAAVLHPIIALPAGFVGMLLLTGSQPKHVRRAAVLLGVIGCGSLLVGLAGGWFTRIDEDWWALLREVNTIVDVFAWTPADWARALLPVAVLVAAARVSEPRLAGVWHALCLVALAGLGLALFSVSTRWELGVQAQFWRMVWPAACAAPMAAVLVVLGQGGGGATRALLLTTLPITALGGFAQSPSVAAIQGCLAVALLLVSGRHLGPLGTHCARLMCGVCAGFVLLAGAMWLTAIHQGAAQDPTQPMRIALVRAFGWVVLPGAVAGSMLLIRRFGGRGPGRSATAGVAALVVAAALLLVDARGRAAIALDREIRDGIDDWAQVIPREAAVFWPGRLGSVWFGLGRVSYASAYQAAGAVFDRAAGFELRRRMSTLRWAGDAATSMAFEAFVPQGPPVPVRREDLAAACTDPALGFVVLSAPVDAQPLRIRHDPRTGTIHRLYACEPMRAAAG